MSRYLFLFVLLNALIGASLFFFYESKIRQTIQADQELISVTFGTAVRQHHTLAKSYFDHRINVPQVQKLMWQANHMSGSALSEVRLKLYNLFKTDYRFRADRFGFKQMQFILANNTSFLRFHRPSAFGDDLTKFRKSVVFVNREHKAVSTFEEGKIFNGFRFIFPLSYQGQQVGSVEISVSLTNLTSVFFSHLKAPALFIVKRKLIDEKAFETEHKNYRISDLNPNYYEEVSQSSELSLWLKNLLAHVHFPLTSLNKRLTQGQFFTLNSWADNRFYLINFFPVFNTLSKTHSGYLVIAREHKEFPPLRNFLISIALILNLLFISLYTIFKKYKRTVKKLNIQNDLLDELQSIAHIGLWEYHEKRGDLYWSPQIYAIIDGHHHVTPTKEYFFRFVHPADLKRVETELQNALAQHNHFTIRHRILRPDGKIRYVVEHGHILRDHNGNLQKAVGLMQDVTEQEEATQQLTRFINSQKDLTVLISGDSIEFANVAFLEFFGLDSLTQYHALYQSLSQLFVAKSGFFSTKDTQIEDKDWLKYFQTLPKSKQLVLMKDQHNIAHAFATTVSNFSQDKVIISFNDITPTIEEKSLLEDQVIHDKLTRAFTRSYLDQYLIKLRNEINSVHGFYLMVMDIDHFKRINDQHGHLIGDRLLQELTTVIQANIRREDKLIRWGGEEFLIIGETHNDIDLMTFADHLRTQIEDHIFRGPHPHLTCSFGLTFFYPDEAFDVTLERADQALYEAKDAGRNHVCSRFEGEQQQERLF